MLSGAERVNLAAGVVKVRMIVAASVEMALSNGGGWIFSGREKPFNLTAAPILGTNTGLLLHGAGLAVATTSLGRSV